MNLSATAIINRLLVMYSTPSRTCRTMHCGDPMSWKPDVMEAAFASDGPLNIRTTGSDRIEASGREMVSQWTVSELEAVVTPVGTYRLMGPAFEMIGARQNRTDTLQLREHLDHAFPPNRPTGNGDGGLVHHEGIQSIGQKHTIKPRRDH